MNILYRSFFVLALAFGFFLFTKPVLATRYDLIPPEGQLTRGQQVQFTIAVDTEESSLTNAQVGMTYDTQYLQYVSASAGNAVNSITVTSVSDGNLLITGTNNQGFTGQGDFAYMNFTLIATAAGSTNLCVLYAPTTPVTPAPTSPANTPVPTQLPQTGTTLSSSPISFLGIMLIFFALALFYGVHRWSLSEIRTHRKKSLHTTNSKNRRL